MEDAVVVECLLSMLGAEVQPPVTHRMYGLKQTKVTEGKERESRSDCMCVCKADFMTA